ncbi:fluoride efflux transporter CrcB [Haoranjiania flava]|uniref:Fluoride-specific ion channel FluC n=1 Tax=Haoranjiania flava TaxID=1856322 RepID=A0AAE3ILV2_9BACT|nr:fluoride efflux transporter CrcB [Haoranjiania flava]MCU7694248.1 fluoride efflux transporter CrcB [Haoranjiania flava]
MPYSMFNLYTIFLIGIGSFIGGVCRYMVSVAMQNRLSTILPYGTLVVNVLGCLLIGIVFAFFEKQPSNQEWKLFLATGVLGGFTTFSAFSNETIILLRNGQLGLAAMYIGASVLSGLAATYLGYWVIK